MSIASGALLSHTAPYGIKDLVGAQDKQQEYVYYSCRKSPEAATKGLLSCKCGFDCMRTICGRLSQNQKGMRTRARLSPRHHRRSDEVNSTTSRRPAMERAPDCVFPGGGGMRANQPAHVGVVRVGVSCSMQRLTVALARLLLFESRMGVWPRSDRAVCPKWNSFKKKKFFSVSIRCVCIPRSEVAQGKYFPFWTSARKCNYSHAKP